MVFVALSRLPPSQLASDLEHTAISLLYRDLPHPPSTHMGPDYQFRAFNAAGNAATVPSMGRSFTPYSRSCTAQRTLPVQDLPDAGLVYDMLIRRDKVCTLFSEPLLRQYSWDDVMLMITSMNHVGSLSQRDSLCPTQLVWRVSSSTGRRPSSTASSVPAVLTGTSTRLRPMLISASSTATRSIISVFLFTLVRSQHIF